MEAKVGSITLPQRGRAVRLPWAIAIAEGLIILALAITVVTVQLGRNGTMTSAQPSRALFLSHADAAQTVGAASIGYGISGTGPGLARMAALTPYALVAPMYGTPATRGVVTGTGPGLLEVAGGLNASSITTISGTGPGLVQVAEDSSAQTGAN